MNKLDTLNCRLILQKPDLRPVHRFSKTEYQPVPNPDGSVHPVSSVGWSRTSVTIRWKRQTGLVSGRTRQNHDTAIYPKEKQGGGGCASAANCEGGRRLRRTAAAAARLRRTAATPGGRDENAARRSRSRPRGGGCACGRGSVGIEGSCCIYGSGSLDMDVDSPPHLPIETSANKVHYSFHICSLCHGLFSAMNPSSD